MVLDLYYTTHRLRKVHGPVQALEDNTRLEHVAFNKDNNNNNKNDGRKRMTSNVPATAAKG